MSAIDPIGSAVRRNQKLRDEAGEELAVFKKVARDAWVAAKLHNKNHYDVDAGFDEWWSRRTGVVE